MVGGSFFEIPAAWGNHNSFTRISKKGQTQQNRICQQLGIKTILLYPRTQRAKTPCGEFLWNNNQLIISQKTPQILTRT